jgi:RNA polymerase sigma-70 factor (ECF subfamily)
LRRFAGTPHIARLVHGAGLVVNGLGPPRVPRVEHRHEREAHVSQMPTPGEIDHRLVRRARDGDAEALRALVSRAYPFVRRWALVRTGDPTEADDLTQDVLVHVMQRLDGFQGSGRFTTWLYTVVRRAAADRFRRQARRRRLERDPRTGTEVVPDAEASPAARVASGESMAVVDALFRRLPARQREVFDLAELQGLTSPEIAERLGIEPVSVRAHLFKARRTLRAMILEHHPQLAPEGTHDV